jgi:hypothetical protein
MGFLIAKILFLLVLAAACGALFAYWWFRRHYEDVTLEYARSRDEWATWRRNFAERIAARPEVDLGPLLEQLSALEESVRDIDRGALEKRLTAIEHALFPVQTRLDELESAVRAFHVPPPQTLDLTPVLERLGTLASRLEHPQSPEDPQTVGH